MKGTTKIDSIGFTFASLRNEMITALHLDHNKKIEYLPEKVIENFPNFQHGIA